MTETPAADGDLGSVGVGVIGLGFMGRMHIGAYSAAPGCRLVAVCDQDPTRLGGKATDDGNLAGGASQLFDPETVRGSTSAEEIFADDGVQLISICTHTTTHVDLAIAALEAGKHVLVEKPVALTVADVQRVADAAGRASTLCMPAMCMRFWPGWSWLARRIADRRYGAVVSAVLERVGAAPDWAKDFYADESLSGSALVDLHIHDADFIRWCFGSPQEVRSAGTVSHVVTEYRYEDGPALVMAEGGWSSVPSFPFRMRFRVDFEEAAAEYDMLRDRPLRLTRNGATEVVEVEGISGYDGEIRHMVESIRSGCRELCASIDDAVSVTRLLECERESLRTGNAVPFTD